MTSAHSVFGPTPDNVRNRANWLGRYLTVERAYDAALDKVLKDAVASIDSAFGDLDDSNISRQIRRQQLALAHKQVKRTIRETFGDVRNLIKNGRQDAAVAAVNAHLFDERGVLARLFKSPADRQNYADSLRATAARNIEAVATRVLQTEIPLSERVWKTRALANGQVSRAINNGLAKGDSWLNIAESVKHLVRPDTPGGISYAAKRLGRTEINNAFHAQSIHDAQQSPWIDQMRWRLSKVHETDPGDECEVYAEQEFFPKEGVPVKPHPNCRCYVIPALLDYDQFETNLLLGQYDSYIDERMGKGTADRIIDFRGIYPKGVKPYGPDLRAKPNPETPPITANIKPIEVKTWRDVQNVNFIEYWFQQAHPDIDVINFNSDNISLEDAKQLLGAVDDMVAKYPVLQGNIKSIVLGYGPDDEYARTIREFNGKSTIKFNLNWTKDHDHFYERVADNVATGFHPPGTDANPYYDMVVHELGHALDNVGDQRARDAVPKTLLHQYLSEFPLTDQEKLPWDIEDLKDNEILGAIASGREKYNIYDWEIDASPSKYALADEFSDINNAEALAEAFLDVERNGKEAKPLSKALYDLLIEESKKDVGPRQLSDLVSAPASESGLVKGDYVPNGVEAWDFIEIPYDDGRWDYYEVYDKRNELGSSHDWTIEPRNYPEKRTTVTKFDRRSTVFFDPKETDVVEGEFGFEITTPEVPLEDSFEDIPEKMLWRGMSKEEYELARKRGYFESLGEYNVGGDPQAGKTYFSTDVGQAGHYATWYAPPQFKPTFDHPGYVVGIEDIPDLVREQGTEVGVPGRIPFKDVKKVYKGKPYAIFPGEQSAVREFNDNWVPGGSVQPAIWVEWSEVVEGKKDTTSIDEILNLLGIQDNPQTPSLPLEFPKEKQMDGVPEGYERYAKALLGQPDRTSEATVFMSVEDLKRYAEYDRSADVDQLQALEFVVKKDGGIRSPLQLSTDGDSALLHEGNHRLLVAERLGIKEVPVKITIDEEVIRNEGRKPLKLDKNLKFFLDNDFKSHEDGIPQVMWSGPKIAEPLGDSADTAVSDVWTSIEFDEYKDDIRLAARQAQEKGYRGFTKTFQEKVDRHYRTGMSLHPSFLDYDEVAKIGKEIVAKAVYSEPTYDEFYRGMMMNVEDVANFVKNKQVSLPLSSFTQQENFANMFATDNRDWWHSSDSVADGEGLMLKLLPGAKGAEINGGESVFFGKFEVVEVIPGELKPNGNMWTMVDGKKTMVAARTPKTVVLRQVSMIEDIPKATVTGPVTKVKVPEISFVEDKLDLEPMTFEDILLADELPDGPISLEKMQDASEVARVLNDFYGVDADEDLGWNWEDMDLKSAKEVGETHIQLANKYPEVRIERITNTYFVDDTSMAVTYPFPSGSKIELNATYFRHYKDFQLASTDMKALADNAIEGAVSKPGFHPAGSSLQPARSTYIHEFGHALDSWISGYADVLPEWEEDNVDAIYEVLYQAYKPGEKFEKIDDDFREWLRNNVSGYSWENNLQKFLNRNELIAEAFDDVERNGDSAMQGSKAIYDWTMKNYKLAQEERNKRLAAVRKRKRSR